MLYEQQAAKLSVVHITPCRLNRRDADVGAGSLTQQQHFEGARTADHAQSSTAEQRSTSIRSQPCASTRVDDAAALLRVGSDSCYPRTSVPWQSLNSRTNSQNFSRRIPLPSRRRAQRGVPFWTPSTSVTTPWPGGGASRGLCVQLLCLKAERPLRAARGCAPRPPATPSPVLQCLMARRRQRPTAMRQRSPRPDPLPRSRPKCGVAMTLAIPVA